MRQSCSLADVVALDVDPGGCECALVAARAVAAPVEAELGGRVTDERDAAMAEVEEVPRRNLAAGAVVDRDAREARVHRVDQDARDSRGADPLDLWLGRERRDDEQAVRTVAPVEELEGAPLPVLRLDVEDHEVVL